MQDLRTRKPAAQRLTFDHAQEKKEKSEQAAGHQRRAGCLYLYFDARGVQSTMLRRDPYALALGYTRTMMGFLLFQPFPRRISMIGLGGGSLAKYCYRHLPDTTITAVEINPDVIALRDQFHVPRDDERFRVVCADGAQYVSGPDHPGHDDAAGRRL